MRVFIIIPRYDLPCICSPAVVMPPYETLGNICCAPESWNALRDRCAHGGVKKNASRFWNTPGLFGEERVYVVLF